MGMDGRKLKNVSRVDGLEPKKPVVSVRVRAASNTTSTMTTRQKERMHFTQKETVSWIMCMSAFRCFPETPNPINCPEPPCEMMLEKTVHTIISGMRMGQVRTVICRS
jgi:hypothetical protein